MCIKYFYKKKYGIDPPADTIKINAESIIQILVNEFGEYVHTIFMDMDYKTCHMGEILTFLDYNYIDENVYVKEDMDCDDFAVALFGAMSAIPKWSALPFGLCFVETPTSNHAVNIFVDNLNTVWFIEPQNDRIFRLPSNWRPYFILI